MTDFAALHLADTSYDRALEELVLLADHCADPAWRCPRCMFKHALSARAYAREATKLDGASAKHHALLAATVRIYNMIDAGQYAQAADLVREIRIEAGPQ